MFFAGSSPRMSYSLLGGAAAAGELHEDEVPHLEVPVLVGDRAALPAVRRTAVEVDLRARAARAGHAHGPEVVRHAPALDALLRQTDVAVPDVRGLVVVVVDRDPELVGVEAVPAVVRGVREELPGERDGPGLEVVAEGEVAGHLEEARMPGGLADLVDVQRPDALLHARGARVRRRRLAQEVRLEGDHAGVDEQQRRVVEDERRGGHGVVPAILEERQEAAPDLGGIHQVSGPFVGGGVGARRCRPW